MPLVLWRCQLGRRKGIWPVKNWVVGCSHVYLGLALLLQRKEGCKVLRWVCLFVSLTVLLHNSKTAQPNTHTHTFNGLFSRTAWLSWHQKGKPFWILLKQEMMGGSGINWTICKSFAPHSRQITTPVPITQFLWARCSSWHPTNSVKALKPTAQPNCTVFLCMLPVAMAWSSPDGVVICYVLLFLWMTSCFHVMVPVGRSKHDIMFRSSLPGGGSSWMLDHYSFSLSSSECSTGSEVCCVWLSYFLTECRRRWTAGSSVSTRLLVLSWQLHHPLLRQCRPRLKVAMMSPRGKVSSCLSRKSKHCLYASQLSIIGTLMVCCFLLYFFYPGFFSDLVSLQSNVTFFVACCWSLLGFYSLNSFVWSLLSLTGKL